VDHIIFSAAFIPSAQQGNISAAIKASRAREQWNEIINEFLSRFRISDPDDLRSSPQPVFSAIGRSRAGCQPKDDTQKKACLMAAVPGGDLEMANILWRKPRHTLGAILQEDVATQPYETMKPTLTLTLLILAGLPSCQKKTEVTTPPAANEAKAPEPAPKVTPPQPETKPEPSPAPSTPVPTPSSPTTPPPVPEPPK
jgi:hypothetical protein